MNQRRQVAWVLVLLSVLGAPRVGRADASIASVAFVSKSENKNQVHYGVHVDGNCELVGPAPVFGYWRMLEKGPNVTEPILPREERAYGIAHQSVAGEIVQFVLRALPARPITVRVARKPDGSCAAHAEMTIAGALARLWNVHIVLGFLRVDYLLLTGWVQGRVVRETLHP